MRRRADRIIAEAKASVAYGIIVAGMFAGLITFYQYIMHLG